MTTSVKLKFAGLVALLMLCNCATSLIIPEELPTILSLIYTNIPPIKKGTDSRVGVGFRLGEHADVQVVLELGPQTETEPIGNAKTKKRRDEMLTAAFNGNLGPLTQAIVKYQTERRIQKELEKLKAMQEKLNKMKITTEEQGENKTIASEWLASWSKDMKQSAEDPVPLELIQSGELVSDETSANTAQRRISRPVSKVTNEDKIEQLTELYRLQTNKNNS